MGQNPSVPSSGAGLSLVNAVALYNDYGGAGGSKYVAGGGAEATLVAGVLAAESQIDTLQTKVTAIEADTSSNTYRFGANLLNALKLSTGAAVPAFNAGVADGWSLDDSEAVVIRINDDSTTVFMASVDVPEDVDDTAAIVLHVRGYRTGTNDVGACLTVGAFAHVAGAAHTADTNAGGDTSAFDVAGADTIDEVTRTFTAGDLPAGSNVSLTFVVKNTTLADDDLCLLDAYFTATRAPRT